jgi:hypothetical protein
MPKLATHCAISKKRTGYDFRELHEWMDSPAAELGYDHRTIRHAYNTKEEKQIIAYWDKKKGRGWGNKAVVEWLFHIAIDNMSTAFKKSYKVYKEKTYNYFELGMSGNGYIFQDFDTLDEDKLAKHFEGGIIDKLLGFFK